MFTKKTILHDDWSVRDKSAFNEIFSVHYRRLVMEAAYLLKEEQDAKDLVQDVFIDLWNKKDLDDIVSIKAYLTQAIRHRCYNVLKANKTKAKKQQGYQYMVNADGKSQQDTDNSDILFRQEKQTHALVKAIQKLPPQTARIFKLYYEDRKSRHDIATEVGVSINTVKTVLSRALQSLRKNTQTSITHLPE